MWRAVLLIALAASTARAEPDACDFDCKIVAIRAQLERGEAAAARDALLALHADTARPELLFALGQVELQLGHYEAAIRYYEQFIASEPGEDQIALAQQAIGAARMKITLPPPQKPPPPPPIVPRVFARRWDLPDTVLVAVGGAAIVTAGALLYNANTVGNDTSGTLAEYDARQDHAHTRRFAGIAAAAGGTIAIAIAFVRLGFDQTEVSAAPTAGGATVVVGRRW
ncbi:MAG: tetratricopeptide repeat protein [Kofleriaceae bacterium]